MRNFLKEKKNNLSDFEGVGVQGDGSCMSLIGTEPENLQFHRIEHLLEQEENLTTTYIARHRTGRKTLYKHDPVTPFYPKIFQNP